MNSPLQIDFIVGMSRTAITWLTRALNLHPELTTFGQSRFWGKYFVAPADLRGYDAGELARIHRRLRGFLWDGTVGEGPGCLELELEGVRRLIDQAWSELAPPVPPSRAFEALARAFVRAGGAEHVLEKTPHHVLHVERIRSHLPRARFVIIEACAQDYAAIQRDQADLRHHPIAVALLYCRYAAACERAAQILGEDAVRVELRALAEHPDRALAPVFGLLGVEPAPLSSMMPAIAEVVPGPFAGPPPLIDRFWLEQLAGQSGDARPSLLELVTSLRTLPPWAFDNLRTNLADAEGSLIRHYADWLGLKGRSGS